ncbi:MAG: hypothetical protein WD825_12330 [Gemmatimonadaceae bacterium]
MTKLPTPAGRYTVLIKGIAVGYSELEDLDPSLGRARGRFRPGVGYDLVQPVFRLFTEAVPSRGADVVDPKKLERYHQARDALGLSLEDDTGRTIRTSAIHIADYSKWWGGTIEIEVLISDPAYWSARSKST